MIFIIKILNKVIIALGGEAATTQLSSMECFTLGYDAWKCSIPTAVALSGIAEPTQVMPVMAAQRVFPAVACTDYTIFVVGIIFFGILFETIRDPYPIEPGR